MANILFQRLDGLALNADAVEQKERNLNNAFVNLDKALIGYTGELDSLESVNNRERQRCIRATSNAIFLVLDLAFKHFETGKTPIVEGGLESSLFEVIECSTASGRTREQIIAEVAENIATVFSEEFAIDRMAA